MIAPELDDQAFSALYAQNVHRIRVLCYRMVRDSEFAEELTQDAFVRAWERRHQFQGHSTFSTWLHAVAVSVVLNALRRRRRDEARVSDDVSDAIAARGRCPYEEIDLKAAIATLPCRARRVFELHAIDGYKHDEIALMLGVSSGTSKSLLHHSRTRLRARLSA